MPEEQVARDRLRKARNNLLQQIKNYEDSDFPTDEAKKSVHHAWSLISRLEEELDKVPLDEDLLLDLAEKITTHYNLIEKKEFTTIPTRDYNKLMNRLERLEAKCSRVSILDLLTKANRKLGQQMLEGLKMETEKARVEYIEISVHAAVLSCFKDVLYISLRRLGYTDADMKLLAKEMKRIEKDYPLLEEDKESIMKRLFGEPSEVIDVAYEPMPDGDDLLKKVNAEVSGKRRRHREDVGE